MAAPVRTVISPSRYVQGKGSIHQLGEYLKPIGSTPLLVADDLVWGLVGHDVEASLKNAGLPVQRETFRGVPSAKEVDRLVDAIKASGADVAVAIGGGSTIDAVKAAGFLADIRWANCPTVASTDAPCSALSVIYTEDGEFEEYRFFPRNPDLVLVDSQVVANAPVDLLVAGVGDALATWLEARATAQSNSNTMAGGLPTLTGTALATQLVLEGAPASEIRDFVEFTTRVGLPNTLTEVGLSADDLDSLKTVADAATVEGETIHAMPFEVRSADVVSALASIERFSTRVRQEARLPEPVRYVAHH